MSVCVGGKEGYVCECVWGERVMCVCVCVWGDYLTIEFCYHSTLTFGDLWLTNVVKGLAMRVAKEFPNTIPRF